MNSNSVNSDSAIIAVPILKSQETPRLNLLPNIGDNFQARYFILKQEGKGGMNSVFKARDNRLGRLVALRFILPDKFNDETNALFVSEGSILASLDHKNVVKIYDLNKDLHPFMVLEWLKGGNLKQLSEQKNNINETELINYTIPILEAISYLHQKRIIHRDLKLANIFLTREGILKIIDFGIAQEFFDIDNTHSIHGPTFFPAHNKAGTDNYRPNEQEITEKTDIYAIGLIIIYLLCYGKKNSPIKKESDLKKIKDIKQRQECMEFISKNSSKEFFEIIESLTHLSAELRITAASALEKLQYLNKRIFSNTKENSNSNPYMSFYDFNENDANRFFGRDEETINVSTIFYKEKILILRGSSGSGKSSLIKAGIFPKLRYESENIIISKIFSENLIKQIIDAAVENLSLDKKSLELDLDLDIEKEISQEEISSQLKKTIKHIYINLRNSKKKMTIFIDRIEDIYSIEKNSQKHHKYLIDFLINLTSFPQDLIKIIVSIKEDFFQFFESNKQIQNYLFQHPSATYFLRAPNTKQMLEMLNNPLKTNNCQFENGLDNKIIEEINNNEQGRFVPLPLLQVVAKTLWDERQINDDNSSIITMESFNRLGGVSGIFNSIYKNFIEIEFRGEQEQKIVREIFLRIFLNKKINKKCKKEELISMSSDIKTCDRILKKFISMRLLIEINGNIFMMSEIFFDWYLQRIKEIEYEKLNNSIKFEQNLKQSAYYWKERGEPKSLLWKEDLISDISIYFDNKEFKDNIIKDFVEESKNKIKVKVKNKQKKQKIILFLSLLILISWSISLLHFNNKNKKLIEENKSVEQKNIEIEKRIIVSELNARKYLTYAEEYRNDAEDYKKTAELEYSKLKYNLKRDIIIRKFFKFIENIKYNMALHDINEAKMNLLNLQKSNSINKEDITKLQNSLNEKRDELMNIINQKKEEDEINKSRIENEFISKLSILVAKIEYENSILKKYDENSFCNEKKDNIKIISRQADSVLKSTEAILKIKNGKIW